MEKCGKHRKQRKTSETTENVGNNGKCQKQRKMSETTENVRNVRIGTGGNMVHDTCWRCFGLGRAFVNMSAVCCGSQQLSIVTSPRSTSSRTQCHRIATCLLWLWNWGFFANAMEPSLSPFMIIGNCCECPSSEVFTLPHVIRAESERSPRTVRAVRGLS